MFADWQRRHFEPVPSFLLIKGSHQNQMIQVRRLYLIGWVARRGTTLQAAPDLCGKTSLGAIQNLQNHSRWRSSWTGKFALEVGQPKFHWTFATFSWFLETAHNQNAWKRKYRVWRSFKTIYLRWHGQFPATEVRQWEVGGGEMNQSCSQWIGKTLYLFMEACSDVNWVCQTKTSNRFSSGSKKTQWKHALMQVGMQIICQTELSYKFSSGSKLRDNAEIHEFEKKFRRVQNWCRKALKTFNGHMYLTDWAFKQVLRLVKTAR